jgi:DNA-binding beta-propeller fold protein YncE
MRRNIILTALLVATGIAGARYAVAGQAPAAASDPDIPVSHQDRVYSAEQYSNTVSVTDPVDNKLVGTIRLGDPLPANLSPLYKGQLLVHGMGFSPDHRTIAVVAIGSNAVNFIDTATNSVKHVTYVGRSPHEAFYTMDGKEIWVVVRGENYVSVLDGTTYEEKTRITVPNGPGMTIFSPDGKYGYVCSSFTPETEVITVADHCRQGSASQPVLSQHRRDTRQQAGLVYPEGQRQDPSVRWASAVCTLKDPRHRSDHQPRQHRAQCQRHVRLRHDRRTQRS